MNRLLLLRADASPEIGVGHVMRCLALAQAWQDAGGRALFACAELPDSLAARLSREKMASVQIHASVGTSADTEATALAIGGNDAAWVVVDSYRFDAEYYAALRATGTRILALDDMSHLGRYPVDVLLNQNLSATETLYRGKVDTTTTSLLGVTYTLLRREFLEWRKWQRPCPTVARKILVTLGGSDPDNVTADIVRAIALLRDAALEVAVVVGGCNPHLDSLQALFAGLPASFRLHRDVQNMPALMAWADVAISGGGSTTWEIAFMGLPALVLVLSPDQSAIADCLQRSQVAVNLGWHHETSIDKISIALRDVLRDFEGRQQMSLNGPRLVDGLGGRRVVEAMNERLK